MAIFRWRICILTDDNKLYTVNEKENGNKQLIAESIIDLGENSRYDEDKRVYLESLG